MAFFYLQGNVESSHLHTFILGAILVMGGIQVILTGFLMKTYSVIHGYENKAGYYRDSDEIPNLEKFLVLGIFFGACRSHFWVLTYLHPLGLDEFRFPFGNLHSNYIPCVDCKRNPDLSLCSIPEYDAPQ